MLEKEALISDDQKAAEFLLCNFFEEVVDKLDIYGMQQYFKYWMF